jgi:hypothetical protein
MVWNLFETFFFIVAVLMLIRFWPNILAWMRHVDEGNLRRIEQERADRTDRNAHFRHTMDVANEQVEEIAAIETKDARTGTPVTLFLFEGNSFASHAEAEKARAEKVYAVAYQFYLELPKALRARREDDRLK